MNKIIFISGIHGVGKDYIANILKKYSKINVYSASDLIKKYSEMDTDIDKKVLNIESNQQNLITSIDTFVKDELFILLGHFCLFDKHYYIKKIDKEIFFKLNLKKIILIVDNTYNIQSRLKKRDNIFFNLALLDKFQNTEIEYANEIASILNIPILKINNDDNNNYDDIINFIKR
ncbi:AAA family ATPase [Brachyspira hampsonii]|nr:AAA family ATPase [Brachyspira hampsonii]